MEEIEKSKGEGYHDVSRSALIGLQDELVTLKARHPNIRLTKAPTTQPGSPFPVILTATIPAPSHASHIDIDSIKFQVTITKCNGQTRGTLEDNHSGSCRVKTPQFNIELAILNDNIPRKLKESIIERLSRIMNNTVTNHTGSVISIGLEEVFAELHQDFATLLCLVPDCMERYEGVDEQGRTIRRIAILNDDTEVVIDTSVSAFAAPTKPQVFSPPRHHQQNRALEMEIEALSRRYSIMHLSRNRKSMNAIPSSPQQQNNEEDEDAGTETGLMYALRLTDDQKDVPTQKVTFLVIIQPTDPQWRTHAATSNQSLKLLCAIHDVENYPAPGSFLVHSTVDGVADMTPQEIAVYDRLLEMECIESSGKPGAVRSVLRQCENRAGEWMHQATDVAIEVERRRHEKAHKERKNTIREHSDEFLTSSNSCSDYSCTSSNSDDVSNGCDSGKDGSEENHLTLMDQKVRRPSTAKPPSSLSSTNSLKVCLNGLQLVDVDTLDITKLNLQVACSRCGAMTVAELSTSHSDHSTTWTGECPTCHNQLHTSITPKIVHESSNVVALFRSEDLSCSPCDVLPSIFSAQCADCSSLGAFRSVQIGKWNERNCGHCHRRLAFYIGSITFVAPNNKSNYKTLPNGRGEHGQGEPNTYRSSGSGSGGLKHNASSFLFTLGQPLPGKGTCRHYRHSYRWLRFPCCGQRFPCDLCHEEGTDGHEMQWANRMVCGFCSLEQPLGQACASKTCGKALATSASRPSGRNTAFWEGGQGQRNKKRLSRKDPHKFRNSKSKTRSRKSYRVGQKAE